MAGVFQPGVFQPGVFQLSDGEPVAPPVTSFGSIAAAFAVHAKPLQRKLPRHIQRHLLAQLHQQMLAEQRSDRLIARVRLQLVEQPRRAVDSSVGLARRTAQAAR